jgi:hypothetical protein
MRFNTSTDLGQVKTRLRKIEKSGQVDPSVTSAASVANDAWWGLKASRLFPQSRFGRHAAATFGKIRVVGWSTQDEWKNTVWI